MSMLEQKLELRMVSDMLMLSELWCDQFSLLITERLLTLYVWAHLSIELAVAFRRVRRRVAH